MGVSEVVIVAFIGTVSTLFAGPLTTAFDKHADRKLERERRQNDRVELIGDKVRQLVACRTALIEVLARPLSDDELELWFRNTSTDERVEWDKSLRKTFYESKRQNDWREAWRTFTDDSRATLLSMAFVIHDPELRSVFVLFRDNWIECLKKYEPQFFDYKFHEVIDGDFYTDIENLLHDFVPQAQAAIEADKRHAEEASKANRWYRRSWRAVTSKMKRTTTT